VLLAQRFSEDFDGQVITEAQSAVLLSATEAKTRRGFLAKMEDPTMIEVDPDVASLATNKNVVIVDDILTSGETTEAFEIALATAGVPVHHVAVLGAAAGGRPALRTQFVELAQILAETTGERRGDVLKEVEVVLGRSRATFLKNALKEARSEPERVRAAIRRRAQALRETVGGGTSDAG